MNRRAILFCLLTGCAGLDRDCAQCGTEVSGANWLVQRVPAKDEP